MAKCVVEDQRVMVIKKKRMCFIQSIVYTKSNQIL